jgi:membrane-bound lytic murein transglycosylase MltF
MLFATFFLSITSCSDKETAAPVKAEPPQSATPAPSPAPQVSLIPDEEVSEASAAKPTGKLALPVSFERRTGDLDMMLKERKIRALVLLNPISFFYHHGKPHGMAFEAVDEFERYINAKYKTGALKVKVTFIPVRPDQLASALTEGIGDFIAYGVAVTPEREKQFAMTVPTLKNISRIVVTGNELAGAATFDDLVGKDIYVNPMSVDYQQLQQINADRQKQGKPSLSIKAADGSLMEDDLIEMVNSDLIPATVSSENRAKLWSEILPNIKAHPQMLLSSGGTAAWVARKDNPQFFALLNEFVKGHAQGTSFGNTVLRRYLKNTKWVKNSLSSNEIRKFSQYVQFFKKYSGQYNFDYLMIAAQAYQESQLDQSRRSPVGAVGVMQVIPKYAAAKPINMPDVSTADKNILAGVKMLNFITENYFNDPAIDQVNKTLFTFASYNAGQNRIVRLRKKAAEDGLDPNKWFGNVELEVAQDIGQETITYVSNIYKYYVAYKLAYEQARLKEKAKTSAPSN